MRRLGAERAVDYTREDFTALAATPGDDDGDDDGDAFTLSYETIFDAAGRWGYGACEPALAPGGIYITTSPGPAIFIARLRAGLARLIDRQDARRATTLRTRPSGDDLETLADLVAAGRLRPVIDRVLPLEEVRQAHLASEAGHPRGKIVLRIDPPRT